MPPSGGFCKRPHLIVEPFRSSNQRDIDVSLTHLWPLILRDLIRPWGAEQVHMKDRGAGQAGLNCLRQTSLLVVSKDEDLSTGIKPENLQEILYAYDLHEGFHVIF